MSETLFNRLEIIGSRKQVKQVRKFLKGESTEDGTNMFIDFNKIIPSPNQLEQCPDWNYDNWGTKWNARFQKSTKLNEIIFLTKNAPAEYLMQKLSLIFPDIIFLYQFDEPNVIMEREVFLIIKNGITTEIPRECFFFDEDSNTKEAEEEKEIYNSLEIIGDDNEVQEVREFLSGKPNEHEPNMFIDLNNIMPCPKEFEDSSEWKSENWVTTKNAFDQQSQRPNWIEFLTDHSITSLIQKLSEKFPHVSFIYKYIIDPHTKNEYEIDLFIKNGIETQIPYECYYCK